LIITTKITINIQIQNCLPADNALKFFNAHASEQLAILQEFSNKFTEDKFTQAQWLAKVVNHKDDADWTVAQTITHVRNAFRGSLLDWYNSLKSLGVDITNWNQINETF
jgi:hypothetical protein